MKRVFYLLSFMALIGCQSSIRSGIERQLKEYPESRVQDIYKCFCQDNLGPEHLIPNPVTARAYLIEEIEEYCEDLDSLKYIKPTLRYFATGDEGNYIRVDLSVVLDEFMTADEYLDAFVRSANRGTKRTTEQWKAKWAAVERCIRKHYMTIPDADKDLQEIKALMDENHFIIHHSDTFGQVYNPHYRIIAKDIFESEILPRINKTKKDMNSALELAQEWDKVFPQSDKVDHKKVTFRNRYGIELAADMYTPKTAGTSSAARVS